MSLARISLRSVKRNRTRFVLTVLGASIAVVAFVLLRTLLESWSQGAEHAAKDRLATRNRVSLVMPLPKRYVDNVREVPGVTAVTWSSWFGGKDPKNPNLFFANSAVDPQSFLQVNDEVELSPPEKEAWFAERRGAIVGDVLAKNLGVKVGDTLTLKGTIYAGDWQFKIVGVYHSSRRSFDRSQLLFRWDYFNDTVDDSFKDQVGWITSRIGNIESAGSISKAIDAVFETRDIQTATTSERVLQTSFLASASAILGALNIVSLILLAIMTLVLGNTMAMGVRERTREYGVLLALGFLPRHATMLILSEATVMGFTAGLLGLGLSYPFVQEGFGRWLEENMGNFLPYVRISAGTAAMAVGLSVLLAVGAAVVPALRASRLTITDALKQVV